MKPASRTSSDLVTVNEFYRLVPDGQKADLLDGVIYMASPDSRPANKIANLIYFLMEGFNAARKFGGEVYASRFAFRLTKYRAPEPDVAFVRKKRLQLLSKREMKGGPDIAVEVVSRDSRKRDYVDKKKIYEAAGVSEYWIIDPLKQRAEFHRLHKGEYQLVTLDDGHIFQSAVLPGFWMDVNWLLAAELPNSYDCLQQILNGPAPTLA
ncbi:MAG: Uma2 family endonuclease [Gemmataceae bacterium]|nr:Uma2 family endonuclease [Gemmataceae bacterium]